MQSSSESAQHLHPIGVVAERTGLTPELLRVWERRYGAVVPVRAAGGGRLYSDDDVRRLRLLRRAVRGGRQIGQIANLPSDELQKLVQEDHEAQVTTPAEKSSRGSQRVVAESLELAGKLDGGALEELLKRAAVLRGTQLFLDEVVAPFLRAVGEGWHSGRLSVAQEHLASRVVQKVVMTFFDSLRATAGAPVFVAASLAGDRHEIGVLLAAATAAAEGWEVVLLGADLPTSEIASAARARNASAVGISVVFVDNADETAREIRELSAQLSGSTTLLIGGGGGLSLAPKIAGGPIHVLADLEGLRTSLRALAVQTLKDVPG